MAGSRLARAGLSSGMKKHLFILRLRLALAYYGLAIWAGNLLRLAVIALRRRSRGRSRASVGLV